MRQLLPLTPDMIRDFARRFGRDRYMAGQAASPVAAQPEAGQGPDTPAPNLSTERAPFALGLLVSNLKGDISQALSPLSYSDRPACELAGQQWTLEMGQSTRFWAIATRVPQVGDLQAMRARRKAAEQDAGASR